MKLDLGAGKNKKEGFIGVDSRAFDGVDVVADLSQPWPWADGVVDEVHCSHMVEHLTAPQRIHFVNELYRVLKVGGKAAIITPHWSSARAYGDLTHQWPPVSEFWFYYLAKAWRDYTCDFDATWGYSLHPTLMTRNQEFQQFAMNFYKEAAQDLHATLTKRG
jgi:SAM-dependent methyltransferase